MSHLLFAMTLAAMVSPTNPGVTCLTARSAVPPEDQSGVYESCIRDEEAAREQLHQRWVQFPASARGICAQPKEGSLSYVELLTCLEMRSGSGVDPGKSRQRSGATIGSVPHRTGT